MKKIYRRLAATYLISMLLIMTFFTFSLYERSKTENYNYLSQLLAGADTNIKTMENEYEEKLELLKEDYLKRARVIEYLLSINSQVISRERLDILKKLMEVEAIRLIKSSGEVFISTEDDTPSLYENPEELEKILDLSQSGAHIHIDTPEFDKRPSSFYVIVKADSSEYAAIRVDAKLSGEELMSRKELIESTLKQAITEHATSIIAVGKDSGKIVGVTVNAAFKSDIENMEKEKRFLDLVSAWDEKELEFFQLNGQNYMAAVREETGMYLVALSTVDKLIQNIAWKLGEGIIGISTVSILTILVVRYHLKKYMFDNLEQMENGLRKVLEGEYNTTFNENEIPELQPFIQTIRELKEGYIFKTEGMNRMEDQLTLAQTEAKFDRLTGLYNRNGFEQYTEEFLRKGKSGGVLILFDLDNFKKVNDNEGHPEGDRILKQFAKCLTGEFQKSACIGRLGGDEFIVLVTDKMTEEALREKLDSVLISTRNALALYYKRYGVSVSIGAVRIEGTIKRYETLYQCVDTALYIAKHLGRDCYYINS